MSLRLTRWVACAAVLAAGLATGAGATALTIRPAVRITAVPETVTTQTATHGLRGAYAPADDSGARFIRIDKRPDFDWRRASPRPGFPPGGFVVHWSGNVTVPHAGSWRLQLRVRGGGSVALFISGHAPLRASATEKLRRGTPELNSGSSRVGTLRTGRHYALLMSFNAPAGSGGSVELRWSRGEGR